MASPCIGFEIGLGHICWYFRAYICSKILKVLHPCIGFGIGLGHIWGHANAWIWYIHAYAWILYIHVLSHISHIPKAEIFGFMFQYLSSERMGLRFWANPIHNTWLDHGEISRTRCTPFCPVMLGTPNLYYVIYGRPLTLPFDYYLTECRIFITELGGINDPTKISTKRAKDGPRTEDGLQRTKYSVLAPKLQNCSCTPLPPYGKNP